MMKYSWRVASALALTLWLGGCAQVTKVEAGDAVTVGGNLVVKLDSPWNRLENAVIPTATTWTVDGIYVDALQFFVGIEDGAVIAPKAAGSSVEQRPLTFRASMEPHEIVSLYEALLTRDGSTFTMTRLEPTDFLGGKGFTFEYEVLRKADDVRLKGRAWAAIRDRRLYVINYSAPRLGFYPRNQGAVERLAQSARLRS